MLQNLKVDEPADPSTATVLRSDVVESIASIARDDWNACFPGELEAYDYLLAVERSGLQGFSFCYVVVRDDSGIAGAMPAFFCDYALETTLPRGRLTSAVESVRRLFPRFLKLKLACLGSPCTEAGVAGLRQGGDEVWRKRVLAALVSGFEAHAKRRRCALIALKDMPLPLEAGLAEVLAERGFVDTGGMATAWRPIDFTSIDAYLATLSPGTRKDMRRKLRGAETVEVERVTDLGPLMPRFMELYRETRERSEWQFEDLTEAYFRGILAQMPDNAFCTVYRVGGKVLAFNLMLHDKDKLVDKFFCMDATAGRPYNLYYLSWFENLRYCLDHGQTRYQSGQAYYRNKLRLGSQLTQNAMFFRHTNPVMHAVLKKIAPYLAGDDGAEDAA